MTQVRQSRTLTSGPRTVRESSVLSHSCWHIGLRHHRQIMWGDAFCGSSFAASANVMYSTVAVVMLPLQRRDGGEGGQDALAPCPTGGEKDQRKAR